MAGTRGGIQKNPFRRTSGHDLYLVVYWPLFFGLLLSTQLLNIVRKLHAIFDG